MLEFPTSDPILAKQVTSKDFDGDIFELGLYVDVDSYRDKPFQKTIRYHLNLDDDYNLKKLTKKKTKFLVWGQAGTGKTTELKYLAKKLTEKREHHVIYFEYPTELINKQSDEDELFDELRLIYFISLLYELKKTDSIFSHFNISVDFLLKTEKHYWEIIVSNLKKDTYINYPVIENAKKLLNHSKSDTLILILLEKVKSIYKDNEILFIFDDLQLENIEEEDTQNFIKNFSENLIISTRTYIPPNKSYLGDYQFVSFQSRESLKVILNRRVEGLFDKSTENLIHEISGGNAGRMISFFNLLLSKNIGNKLEFKQFQNLFNEDLGIKEKQIIQIRNNIKKPNFLNSVKARDYFQNENLLFSENYKYILDPIISKIFSVNNGDENIRPLNPNVKDVAINLSKINIQDFRGIKELLIEDIAPKSNFIFILGENGYGKTSLLQSIALGFLGDTDRNKIMIDDNEREKVLIELEFIDNEEKYSSIYNEKYRFGSKIKAVFCYGSSRLSVQNSQAKNEVTEKSSNMYGLFYDDNNMLDIEYELSSKWEQTDNRFQQTQTLLKRLIPHLKEIKVNENKDIEYFEIDSSYPLKFNQLSAASKAHIALFGDLIIKFLKQYPETTNFADFEGIVIIDELELHLHPKWQRELPTLLAEIFPKVQFIVSTHSVFPILGAPKNSVFIKVYRNDERGVWAEKIDIDPTNLTPNILFTSPLFDMDSILSVNNTDITEVRLEENIEEMEFADEVKAKLKAITGKDVPNNILKLPN